MSWILSELTNKEREPVIDIFNYYIENSFAAYPETKVGYEFYDLLMQSTKGYPRFAIKMESGKVVGFTFLRSHNPMSAFKRTAEISYFILPDFTGQGIGKTILERMVEEANKIGIYSILAGVSSLNAGSIKFHLNNGFQVCGIFKNIGIKNGKDFDVIWLQRILESGDGSLTQSIS